MCKMYMVSYLILKKIVGVTYYYTHFSGKMKAQAGWVTYTVMFMRMGKIQDLTPVLLDRKSVV